MCKVVRTFGSEDTFLLLDCECILCLLKIPGLLDYGLAIARTPQVNSPVAESYKGCDTEVGKDFTEDSLKLEHCRSCDPPSRV